MSSGTQVRDLWTQLSGGVRWNRWLTMSTVAIGAAAVVFAANVPGFVRAAVSPSVDDLDPRLVDPLLEQHGEASLLAQNRFNGRSLFFIPPAPKPPAPPPPPRVDAPVVVEHTPPPDPGPPPPPASYTGPKPYSMLGSRVYFENGLAIRTGEEENGVKVISVDPPWTARLGHMGGEYDVPVTFGSSAGLFVNTFAAAGDTPGLLRPEDADESTEGLRISDADRAMAEREAAEREGARVAEQAAAAAGHEVIERGGDPENEAPPEAPSEPPPIPEELSAEQIQQMSRADAMTALSAISRARQRSDLDEATQQRLKSEFQLLLKRINPNS